MASQYKLMLQADVDVSGVSAKVKSFREKIPIQFEADTANLNKIQLKLEELESAGLNISKINLFGEGGQAGKAVFSYTDALGNLGTTTQTLTPNLKNLQKASVDLTSGFDGFRNQMLQSIKTTASYALSIGLLYGALNQIKEGIQYIKDLNKELTNIQLVTGDTDANTAKLGVQYNNLAKQMGATTIEVAKGSLEYIRQGKTAEETQILLKNTLMMSKLGNMETADSTEALTSIMNGYKLKAEETTDVVNKLVAIDNIAATSVAELSTAMRYSSASAQQVGIDFNHLAAYIGTVSSVTRISAETIGQSMKTISARMTAIKEMKAFDSEGEDINKVETALNGVGVKLRDTQGHFRAMQDVLDELAHNWSSFSKENQIFIAQQLGGVRQQNIVLSLLSNEAEIQKQLNAERNAGNLASERYAIYLKSIEASQNKLTASWEAFVSSGATKAMITSFYNMATSILNTINAWGGLPTVIKIATVALIAFNFNWLTTQRLAAGSMFSSLIAGIKGIIASFQIATPVMAEAGAMENVVATGFYSIAASEAVATLGLLALVALLVNAIQKTAELKAKQDDVLQSYKDSDTSLKKTAQSYQEYIIETKKVAEANGYMYDSMGRMYHEGYHGAKIYTDGVKLLSEAQFNASKSVDDTDRKVEKFDLSLTTLAQDILPEVKSGFKDFATTLKDVGDKTSSVDDVLKNYMKNGLTIADASKIPPEYLDALTVEGDKLKINIDLIKQKELEQVKASLDQIKTAQENGQATQQEVDVIQAAYNQLEAENQHTYGAFHQTAASYNALLWDIANNAIDSGYVTFKNTQGHAMTSAQAIYDYLSASSGNFNTFIKEAAVATGQTTAQVMNTVGQMISQTYNNAMQMMANLAAAGSAAGAGANGLATYLNGIPRASSSAGSIGSVSSPNIFTAPAPPEYNGSMGGGGKSSANSQQTKIDSEIKKAQTEAENSLKNQLKTYKDIVDERKKLLDSLVTERKYSQDVEDKNKNILNLQNELATLANDNSAEAKARAAQLKDELAKAQKDLGNTEYAHSIDVQKNALDANYAALEDKINKAIQNVQAITATSVSDFAKQLAVILAGLPAQTGSSNIPTYHEGGIVGGASLKSNEVFAKLLKKEGVFTPSQMDDFMKTTLPQMIQSTSNIGGNTEINMPINVAGSLDKSTLPDLKKMIDAAVKQINENMMNRGVTRRADMYSI